MIRAAALLLSLLLARPALAEGGAPLPRTAAETARIQAILAAPTGFTAPEPFESLPAGAASVRRRATADAFSQPSGNMSFARQMQFQLGNALFTKTWVAAPASTRASDGLGPLFNARACQDCHIKDGRGHAPNGAGDLSMLLRLSLPGGTGPAEIADWLATRPDPVYGGQLQDFATSGQTAEGKISVTYTEIPVTLADGTTVSLRAPAYAIADPAYGPPDPALMLSPRVAPQMIGLGLLEAIPASDILSREDPDDADHDGISGRAARLPQADGAARAPLLGRFGLKGGAATIRDQTAAAFSGDMGLSSALHPDPAGDCTAAQTACHAAPDGQDPDTRDGVEVGSESLDLVTFYARNLGVPDRPLAGDPTVLQGKRIFHESGCPACHTPKHVTARLTGQPEQSFQLVWPYTDLLLHDMGAGLADGRPEGRATGSEWKTPPLWGIGLTPQVTGHASYLHDGRARSLLEAILWHGGEGQAARDRVTTLPAPDRKALIAFLESL
ncbi:di-heme oxidoredictase family protein [Paragemmobacter straminiformis]|uniref:C-type cytochrome n=1 Tax=Paragemmobacter straminiformis TaxID=2045119 RepID=A0A842I759_9RHOB|nr:di-heme oxidoredictase family protein [Gemmobacter straminiformis]MBC2834818.1 c-type cytochrome [Gemmobacter straminiformis]